MKRDLGNHILARILTMKRSIARTGIAAACILAAAAACSDNPNVPQQGTSTGELSLLNAMPASAGATLRIDGQTTALPASGTSGTADLSAGDHQLQVYSGAAVVASKSITMVAGTHRTAVLSGTVSAAMLLVNTLDSAIVPLTDAAKLRLVHTVPDAPSTDAYLFLTTQAADSSTRFVFPFNYGTGTDANFPGFGVRPPGSYLVWLKAAGTNTVLVQGGPFTVAAGDVWSFVLARNDAGALEIRAVKEH